MTVRVAELAEALGNDPSFATTMLSALAGKQPSDSTLTNLSGNVLESRQEHSSAGYRLKIRQLYLTEGGWHIDRPLIISYQNMRLVTLLIFVIHLNLLIYHQIR